MGLTVVGSAPGKGNPRLPRESGVRFVYEVLTEQAERLDRSHRRVRTGVVGTQALPIVIVVGEHLVELGRVLDLILRPVDVDLLLGCVDPLDDTCRQHDLAAEDPRPGVDHEVRRPALIRGLVDPTDIAVNCGNLEAGQINSLGEARVGSVLPWLELHLDRPPFSGWRGFVRSSRTRRSWVYTAGRHVQKGHMRPSRESPDAQVLSVGSATCPMNSGVPLSVSTRAKANGWSARIVTGRRAEVGRTIPVAAAASVPSSSTVMLASCTTWSIHTPGSIPEKSAPAPNGTSMPSSCNGGMRSRSVAKSQRGIDRSTRPGASRVATSANVSGASSSAGVVWPVGTSTRMAILLL